MTRERNRRGSASLSWNGVENDGDDDDDDDDGDEEGDGDGGVVVVEGRNGNRPQPDFKREKNNNKIDACPVSRYHVSQLGHPIVLFGHPLHSTS